MAYMIYTLWGEYGFNATTHNKDEAKDLAKRISMGSAIEQNSEQYAEQITILDERGVVSTWDYGVETEYTR